MAEPDAGVCVILVAAGSSSRMGGERPKVWLDLDGRPVVARSLATLAGWRALRGLALVVRATELDEARLLLTRFPELVPLARVVVGGAERSDSVRAGLAALKDVPSDVVLVHDAARPLASRLLFERVVEATRRERAAVPALAVVDTLKRTSLEGRLETVPRAGLHAVQTPQGFERELLVQAHARPPAGGAITDDAMLVEALGERVTRVEGEPWNLKITTPVDLDLARRLIAGEMPMELPRIGLGHDLHRLEVGGPLRLAGVDLDAPVHAVGHSDGDVVLHALADAILGALALGDLGSHFSERDPANRGRDSTHFVAHVIGLARARGYRVWQIDATVHLERPKLAPCREQLVARLGELLALPADRVSLKAKTAEGLGPIGAGEAIACDVIVLLRTA